ncbi:MFS transporter, partial [Providencia rettgeri]|nr:MFS transporter [Providencia rettgeri]
KRLSFYMTSLYGGTTLGQLAIGVIGTHGAYPFMVVLGLLLLAVMPPLFVRGGQPESGSHQKLSLKKISRLSKPAIIGCMVSG